MNYKGTTAFGLHLPVLNTGDDLKKIILNTLIDTAKSCEYIPKENDIIGITESVVARTANKCVTIDDVAESLKKRFLDRNLIYVYNPIFSQEKFSGILRAIARTFDHVVIVGNASDEMGNYHKVATMTDKDERTVEDYYDIYNKICKEENCLMTWVTKGDLMKEIPMMYEDVNILDCTLHPEFDEREYLSNFAGWTIRSRKYVLVMCGLVDICNDVSKWGLLGSNLLDDNTLELFPDENEQGLIESIQDAIKTEFNLNEVHVMIYGDGCYKDPRSGVWSFTDPVVSPVFTSGLDGSTEKLGSLMDLISGHMVVVQNYF